MNRRRVWLTVIGLITAALLGILVSGCGGGGAGVQTSVAGYIVDVTTGLGIGNVVVMAGGQSGTSKTPEGRFEIGGLDPGTYALTVQPGGTFVAVPGPAPQVTVGAGQVTEVGTVLVIDYRNLPPAP